ncbi:MAG: helix-turn-helix domain-containing protein [Bacteroidales bacterium]|nr:helix-turn-helix domain-containing protein [Bacteroidales bacterium]
MEQHSLIPQIWTADTAREAGRVVLGDDIVMVRRMTASSFLAHPFRLDYYVLIICRMGSMRGTINMMSHTISYPSLAMIQPGSMISFDSFSDDFRCYYILISRKFLDGMNITVSNLVPLRFFLMMRDHPVLNLSSSDSDVVVSYFNLLYRIVRDDTNPYRDKCALDIIRSFFYLAASFIGRNMDSIEVSERDPLITRLMTMIHKHARQHRDVAYYADRLSLSPNHLYKLIKSATGRSVHEWIDEYLVSEAKAKLKTTDMTVQQISDDLNFPSQSFFGKYFKRLTGMSPREYRKA